jgi:hypothetical protein
LVEIRFAGQRHDLILGENDLDAALARSLGHHVDRRRLDLDDEDLGIGAREIFPQPGAVGQVAGDGNDLSVEPVGRRR